MPWAEHDPRFLKGTQFDGCRGGMLWGLARTAPPSEVPRYPDFSRPVLLLCFGAALSSFGPVTDCPPSATTAGGTLTSTGASNAPACVNIARSLAASSFSPSLISWNGPPASDNRTRPSSQRNDTPEAAPTPSKTDAHMG